MKIVTIIFALISLGLGLMAARYWYRASGVKVVPLWVKLGQIEPVEPDEANAQWQVALIEAGNETGKLNAVAAKWTAAAVAAGCITSIAGAWQQ